jgi:integrase
MARIVEKMIAKLEQPESGAKIHYDSEVPGFGVKITSGGTITFVLNYCIHGREHRYTIGKYPELTASAARDRALKLRGQVRDGIDPLEEREQDRKERTLGELASDYLKHAESYKRASSLRNDRQMIEGIIRPKIGSLRLKAVGRSDIEDLHSSLKGTPYRANRVLALISTMFNYAVERGICSGNPAKNVPRFPEDRRERWLTAEELQSFTAALDAYSDQNAANALRLLLLTGAREMEVLKADWSQFDLKRGIWTKPSHHTKQKKIEHVPLSAPALDLLGNMKPKVARGPLFPSADGKGSRVTLRRPWVQACKAAGLVEVEIVKGKRRNQVKRYRPTLRLHDLRHTYASHLVSKGVSLKVVGRLLGHTLPSTTDRYAHVQDEALRDATNVFGAILKTEKGSQL